MFDKLIEVAVGILVINLCFWATVMTIVMIYKMFTG